VNAIREAVDAYWDWHEGVRSSNWNRDNSYVLRRWAEEIGCESVAEITAPILQAWFGQKLRTLKIQTAAAYLKSACQETTGRA